MRISNSKKQLAKIINENGGWREGAEFAWLQGKRGGTECREVWLGAADSAPEYVATSGCFHSHWSKIVAKLAAEKFPNWHQTILSRDEYFYLHPLPAEVVVENKTTCTLAVPDSPSIEQMAADYRSAKDYAERLQEEANNARTVAARAKDGLIDAGKSIGLVLSVMEAEPRAEKPIAVGDCVIVVDSPISIDWEGVACTLLEYDAEETTLPYLVCRDGKYQWVRGIRRPAKETNNA
jgi:hypothetical protein